MGEHLENQAKIYDDLVLKCQELENEIKDLQIKNNITEEEIKNIDEEIEKEMKVEETNDGAAKEVFTVSGKRTSVENQDSLMNGEISEDKDNVLAKMKDQTVPTEDSSYNNELDDGIEWLKGFQSVPPGWTLGLNKSDRSKRLFKSPEGFMFENRVKALEFMINGDYSDEVLSEMRRNLKDEGWYYDKSCPGNNWKIRKLTGKKDYEYLSPNMEIIPSMKAMLSHMQVAGTWPPKEIKNLESKMKNIEKTDFKKPSTAVAVDSNSKSNDKLAETLSVPSQAETDLRDKENVDVERPGIPGPPLQQEEILPGGWVKKLVGGSSVYISPSGSIVHSIQQVLAAIKKEKEIGVNEKSESKKAENPCGEKRKFEDVFQATKIEEASKPNKKEKLESTVTGTKTSKRDLSDAHIKLFTDVLQSSILPDATKIKQLAAETKLSQKDIKKWFLKRVHEEGKRRLINNTGKENKPKQDLALKKGSKPNYVENFKDMTKDHKKALEEIFEVHPVPTVDMLTEVSTKLNIDLKLLTKWFSLRGQQRKKSS